MVIKSKGFSLIELLVAMAIMSMTIMISSMGYSFFMKRWDGEIGQFDNTATFAKKLILTKNAVSGIYPYIVTDTNDQPGVYFEGIEDGIVGVTSRSFFSYGKPAVFKLQLRQNNNFLFDLIYEESPLDNKPLISLTQNIVYRHKVTLLSQVDDLKFSYYGTRDNQQKLRSEKQWWQSFNSFSRKILPEIVRISFIYQGKQEDFDFSLSQVDPRILVLFNENI